MAPTPAARLGPRSGAVTYGIDPDRVTAPDGAGPWLRRRLQGRFPIDAFGGDPMIGDTVDPVLESLLTIETEGDAALPEIGAATLVTSRRLGPGDPFVVRAAVRRLRRRRARVLGYPDLPLAGTVARKLGAVRFRGEDLAAVLRAGHLAVVPLAPSLRPLRAGTASVPVLWGAIGYPVIPVAVTGGAVGPLGVPAGLHRVVFGAPLELDDLVPRDPLAAAELATAARDAVQTLLAPSPVGHGGDAV